MDKISFTESKIKGSLQIKILLCLRENSTYGKDLMQILKIKSPGTIYPALKTLTQKGLIDFKVEKTKTNTKKIYFLSDSGKEELTSYLQNSAQYLISNSSLYINRVLGEIVEFIELENHLKVFCNLDENIAKKYIKHKKITFSKIIDFPIESFDAIICFLGAGLILNQEDDAINSYLETNYAILRKLGRIILIEIEQTDNLFVRILFEDILKEKKRIGLERQKLLDMMIDNGFSPYITKKKSGLIYIEAKKVIKKKR